MQLTVASFNLNNLFSRFSWSGTINPAEQGITYLRRDQNGVESELPDVAFLVQREGGDRVRTFKGKLIGAKDPAMTSKVAQRITAMNADVLLVQEVEDQLALEDFNRAILGGSYTQVLVIDGNDERFIDVGVMVRGDLRIGRATTWKHTRNAERPDRPIFSRDLLEVELLDSQGRHRLTVFNTHLKSHFVDPFNHEEHRPKTEAEIAAEHQDADELRGQQADSAAKIMDRHMHTAMLLAGDMNDPPESQAFKAWRDLGLINALANATETQAPPRIDDPQDVPTSQLWSHRFPVARAPDDYRLFDHFWATPTLLPHASDPLIHRRSKWTTDGSDHDPVSIRLELP